MNELNLERLMTAAEALRPLLGELVFVGGSVTGLLITDEAAACNGVRHRTQNFVRSGDPDYHRSTIRGNQT